MDAHKPELRVVREAPLPRALPLSLRRRQARVAAAWRVTARIKKPLSQEQRSRDPLVVDRKGSRTRWLRALRAAVGSVGVHALIVALGFLTGAGSKGQREKVEQVVKIEVREPPPPPPPPPELPPEPAQVEAPKPRPEPKVVAKAPPPKAPPTPEPPPEQPPTPPPRVVGISMESTTEGGNGPAFAVGNTRAGQTADKAADPNSVPKEAPSAEPAPGTNAVASRLPSAGVRYTPPKRLREPKLNYPETLKTQQLEADVKVSLSIDATGKVTAVKILSPSPYPEFNDAAKATALGEAFEPATRDGVPIPYSLPFTYRFRLQDE
jgi:protein TonB